MVCNCACLYKKQIVQNRSVRAKGGWRSECNCSFRDIFSQCGTVYSETLYSVASVGQACLDRRERSSVEQDDGNR